ncbi:hypothetical protein NIES2119_28550 [[Phormidium ambiguum] IAM M-71]|uniref:Uncharacterized protein n=1 Tax=[Phormidium ambiguum] IAM M-71 TaxID=454136 RepID=A0A1U7I5Q2_9CYAN|nr:hypothetical protein [Phormidium ambiguum]OKH31557.1 hypothetical protein NIES2119_28550 [Phormidium ambiguum IAM M-71]
MKANYSYASAVFNADFNNFAPITANQAWSLFFTLGKNDAALGDNPEVGKLFTNITIASVVTFMLGACIFTSI